MDTIPNASDLWLGIGGHFDSLSQVICEFIDNSISNFEANSMRLRSVTISLEELGEGKVEVTIEDTGTGIQNLEAALRIGDRSVRETPLNEHGFGLKHAIATANPQNDNWQIYTRVQEDIDSGRYKFISSPYAFNINPEIKELSQSPWPGAYNSTGTLVKFLCSRILFDTIQKGIRGRADFRRCLDYLKEELGYIYAGVIKMGQATITICSSALQSHLLVEAIEPDWNDFYDPGQGNIQYDLGGGELSVEYAFGEMNDAGYIKHYKRNMSTSGVELRVNGRLIMSNLFKEVWGTEPHPWYNHFLVTINLQSENRDALPKTRTSKNGICSGDEKLSRLYEWIKSTCPKPHKDLVATVSERELVKELKVIKEQQIRAATKHIETEFEVYTSLDSPVSVDLYVYDGSDTVLYEAKKDTADIQNVYQLLMYWDGAVADGLKPTEGILLASNFSPGVDAIINHINTMRDQNGDLYKMTRKTWRSESIPYPSA